MTPWWWISRALALVLLGIPGEMLCSCVHRRGWKRFERWLDHGWYNRTGETSHCAACWRWDRAHGRYEGLSGKDG